MKVGNDKSWKYFNPQFEYEQIFNDIDWPWSGHKYFIYDFIRNLKPKTVVELGTHKGTSFFSMCQAAKDGKLKTKLYAVDTWKGDEHAGFYGEDILSEVKKIKKTYYEKQNIFLIQSLFDEAVSKFKNNSIDLLHIDGLHTYDAVKHDFDNWFNKVRKNGIIIFHDTNEKMDDFGVYKLWDKLKKKYKTLEFFHSHGLGILFKNQTSAQNHKAFETIWQKYYPILTDKKVLTIQLQQYLSEIKKIKEEFTKKSFEAENYKKELKQTKNELEQTKTENKNLNDTLNIIKSAKFFKLWQRYCKLRDSIIKRQKV